LDFKQSVEIPDVISVLKEAAEGDGFGDFKVDSGSIQAISDDQLPSSTQGPSSTEESTPSGTVAESFVSPMLLLLLFNAFVFIFLSLLIRFHKCSNDT